MQIVSPVEHKSYRDILRSELERRRHRNPRYSQAAFARDLGLSASRLNEILHSKQGISPGVAHRVAQRLGLSAADQTHFCDLVKVEHSRDKLEREAAQARVKGRAAAGKYRVLNLDAFRAIADWWHLSILELTKLEGFKGAPVWIAAKLGISVPDARDALERLKRLGLMDFIDGNWKACSTDNLFPGGTPARAGKRFHAQMLRKAMRSIQDAPLEQREISTTLMAIDRQRIPYIRARIAEFWQSLDAQLAEDANKTDVYCLGVQLFKVSVTDET